MHPGMRTLVNSEELPFVLIHESEGCEAAKSFAKGVFMM
jgi:hypothetical protein